MSGILRSMCIHELWTLLTIEPCNIKAYILCPNQLQSLRLSLHKFCTTLKPCSQQNRVTWRLVYCTQLNCILWVWHSMNSVLTSNHFQNTTIYWVGLYIVPHSTALCGAHISQIFYLLQTIYWIKSCNVKPIHIYCAPFNYILWVWCSTNSLLTSNHLPNKTT
jgi:hypothetical protein